MIKLKEFEKAEKDCKQRTISSKERLLISYLQNLKGKSLNIVKMSKETRLGRPFIYKKIEELKKEKILTPTWQLNPFSLGFIIIEAEAKVVADNEKAIIKQVMKHPAVSLIRKSFKDNISIDVVVRDINDYYEIEKQLKKFGLEFIQYKIITDKLYES